MPVINLEFKGNFAIIRMVGGENRFSIAFLDEFIDALDKVLISDSRMLITTGSGKYFSNGLKIDWLVEQNHGVQVLYLNKFYKLLEMLLTFPLPTLAAINGHAYAGGAFLAICHDYRLMNADKGWFCFPEVKMGISFTDALITILKAKITDSRTLTDCIVYGKKCTGQMALEYGLVDGLCPLDRLLEEGVTFLADKSTIAVSDVDRDTLQIVKRSIYESAVNALKTGMPVTLAKL